MVSGVSFRGVFQTPRERERERERERDGAYDASSELAACRVHGASVQGESWDSTEGPSGGYPSVVLGAIVSFLEQFCGHLSAKNDQIFQKCLLIEGSKGLAWVRCGGGFTSKP